MILLIAIGSMRVIDSFIFYNELELLSFRLAQLDEFVDYFIIVESSHTFVGNQKDLFFEKNKSKYKQYLDKIIYVVVEDSPNTSCAWDNEMHQRKCISRGIEKLDLDDQDIIIVSDLDEIVDPDLLEKIKSKKIIIDKIYRLCMDLYFTDLNHKLNYHWKSANILNYKLYNTLESGQQLRTPGWKGNPRHKDSNPDFPVLAHRAGWHFSYFGTDKYILSKLSNFSHQERKVQQHNNEESMLNGSWKKSFEPIYIKIEDNEYLPKNYETLLEIPNLHNRGRIDAGSDGL